MWYQSSHLTLNKKADQSTYENEKVFWIFSLLWLLYIFAAIFNNFTNVNLIWGQFLCVILRASADCFLYAENPQL